MSYNTAAEYVGARVGIMNSIRAEKNSAASTIAVSSGRIAPDTVKMPRENSGSGKSPAESSLAGLAPSGKTFPMRGALPLKETSAGKSHERIKMIHCAFVMHLFAISVTSCVCYI